MAEETRSKPSFSPYRKWGVGVQVVAILLVVFAIVVMLNYVSRDYFLRFHWSTQTRNPLSARTVKFLSSVTNQVKVTVYYDRSDPLYGLVANLLDEYKLANSKIVVQTIDYLREPGAAAQLQQRYPFLASPGAKNLVIFDCEGRVQPVEGNVLAQYLIEQMPDPEEPFRKKLITFEGEKWFTATLLKVTSSKKLNAYFLQSDGEHSVEATNKDGYMSFALVLAQNYVQPQKLFLQGTNPIPSDCDLLVIAGPTQRFSDSALQSLEDYLNKGNRMLALLNFRTATNQTGLESVLAKWGVSVGDSIIQDPDNTTQHDMTDLIVRNFGKHPIVDPLHLLALELVLPRAVGKASVRPPLADAPHVEELAFTGPRAFPAENPQLARVYPLMVAVEKGAVKDVATGRGTTRLVVAGDSLFLDNQMIEGAANRNFASYAANWLLDRPQLLADIGSQRIKTYQLAITTAQMQTTEWLLLAGMPGGVLFLGFLVWLRRRR